MTEDWDHYRRVLVDASKTVLRRFYERRAKEEVIAIGYVFELWNASPQFDLCANVGARHDEREEVRWNSGDYKFPAGLLSSVDELGTNWTQISERLHQAAADQDGDGEVYQGLIGIACRALVDLARSGLFGDPTRLDFNVSEVSDSTDVVVARNRSIHEQLKTV
ncbi:MAG TPA: hypothetical protein DDZ88_09895 [Verrucomicrobiales bacterium]|nr:hypothetical protein [Verrucomicrobiales bacterium]